MDYKYKTTGTCSKEISFSIDENGILSNVSFVGGCNGNLQGVSKLVEGQNYKDVIEKLDGIKCGFKSTSCPDQLANALKEAMKDA